MILLTKNQKTRENRIKSIEAVSEEKLENMEIVEDRFPSDLYRRSF